MSDSKLRLYQVEAVKDVLDKKKVIIADDMGLGKSAEAIATRNAIEKRRGYHDKTMVVSPASVIPHWENEIKRWYKGDVNISVIQTATYHEDIKEAKDANFVIIGYPTLSIIGENPRKIAQLSSLKFDYGIVDEVHNAKNPESTRSKAVRDLFGSMEYLTLLSGTPIPNNVIDIYVLLNLLDREKFPLTETNPKAILRGFYNLFRRDPEAVSELLNSRMIRRTIEGYLDVPKLRQHDLEVKLEGEHKDVYLEVYENDNVKPASKLIQLIKASIDPNLVNPRYLPPQLAKRNGQMESCVYNSLDDLIARVASEKGKVLVFSNLKEGVTDKLKERYSKWGAVVIDGEVPSTSFNKKISEREHVRRRFQNDPDCRVLIATTVMNEGVDLTAATDVVRLTLPYTPAEFDQGNRRSQRNGEVHKEYTNVHVTKPCIDSIPIITHGIEILLKEKRRIIDYILNDPLKITYQDLAELSHDKPIKSKHLRGYLSSPKQVISRHLGSLKGMGWRRILSYYEKNPEEAEHIARLYAHYWEGYPAGNTANLYAQVINLLKEKNKLERKLDIASGPFSLSRILKEPVTNLDINHYMLEAGRMLEEKGEVVKGNISVKGSFHNLPFKAGSFDLAVCSLALHDSRLKSTYKGKETRERELALREANRVLTKECYYILTLPYPMILERDLPTFHQGLEQLGFQVLPFSGFYVGPKGKEFKAYLGVAKKVSEPCKEPLEEGLLRWEVDIKTSKVRVKRRSKKPRKHAMSIKEPKKPKKEVVNEFYHAGTQKSLEDSMKEC